MSKMVKSKRDLVTPRKRASLTKRNGITRALPRPVSAVSTPAANVKVVIRVRPPNEREQSDNFRNVIKVVDEQMLIFDPKEDDQPFFFRGVQQRGRDLLKKANKDLKFMFDKVFNSVVTNYEIFENSTQSLITNLMDGYNCSVFAYGATGAGKTFTMIGSTEYPGITFLTMTELFKKKEELSIERDFELGITYLEVYNELVKDLLNPGSPLHLREDGKYGVLVAGIKVHKINDPSELFNLLKQGNRNRTQHPTDANAESSRSHAVFQVYIQMTMKGTGEVRTAKLSMIDLAGSERGSATGCVGARFTEGANINKSLLALGNCINSLADGQRHVPYRDSKLTRLLKDSLGGNCQTIMIANVSPSSLSFEDTYNTLKYATRAKKIKSNIKRNVVNVELHVGHYVKLVDDLQKEIAMLKKENANLQLQLTNVNIAGTDSLESKSSVTTLESKSSDENIVENIEPTLLENFKSLFEEKQELIERSCQVQISESGMNLRRQLKQETDSRLSGLCTSTPEKAQAHRKLNSAVDRFHKKESTLSDELVRIENLKLDLDNKIGEFIEKNPQLQRMYETERYKLLNIEYLNKCELERKQKEMLLDDHREKCSLLEKMAALLKPCYLSLKGHGFATSALTKQYESLVRDFLGRKNIKWGDIPDSGVSSSASLSDDDSRANKRKIEEVHASTDSLDGTFTMPMLSTPRKPRVKISAQQIMVKACKPPPPKRLANGMSPRNKENKPLPSRKPLGRIETARAMVATKSTASASRTLGDRPPFRR